MKIKRIWFVSPYSMPPQYEMRIKTLMYARILQRKGIECLIFTASTIHNTNINLISDNSPYIVQQYEDLHYVHIRCSNYSGNGLKRINNMEQFSHRFKKYAKNFPLPDVIISDVYCPVYSPIYSFCKKNKIPFVVDVRDLWPLSIVEFLHMNNSNPIIQYLYQKEKRMYKYASEIIFSFAGGYDYIKEKHWEKEIPQSKVHYINNGVDLQQFNYDKEHFQVHDVDLVESDCFKVVYTGSIRKANNIGLLLDIAKLIKDPKIKFLVWGDGDELPMLKKRLSDENIHNVVFKGQVEKKYIPYIVSCADLNFVHYNPNSLFRFGVSGNKIFDYMAAGKPILCDVPCKYNPVTLSKCGFDVKESSPRSIAEKIEEIVKISFKEYQEICENALNASKEYEFSVLTDELLGILLSISTTN